MHPTLPILRRVILRGRLSPMTRSGPVYGGMAGRARRVVSTSAPIFASTNLRVAITARLLDAEGNRDERIIVSQREGLSGARRALRGADRVSCPPCRGLKWTIHSPEFDFGEDSCQALTPSDHIDSILFELFVNVLSILGRNSGIGVGSRYFWSCRTYQLTPGVSSPHERALGSSWYSVSVRG